MLIKKIAIKLDESVFQYLSKGGFLKSIAKLSSAAIIGQLFSLLAYLILTRIYVPEEFGMLSIFMSLLTQATVFTSLRYEWSIPTAQDEDEAFDLVLLCCLIVVGITFLTVLVIGFGSFQVGYLLNTPKIVPYLYLLPIGTFFIGLYQVFNYWALRKKEFSMLAKSQIMKSIWTSSSQVVLGLILSGPLGLLIGAIVNQISGTNVLLSSFWKDYEIKKPCFSLHRLLKVARTKLQFAFSCVISSFFNYSAIVFPPLLLSLFYTSDDVGYFALAQRVSSIPTVLLCTSISQVYFANACELIHQNPTELKRLHTRTTLLLFGISSIAGVVFLFSRWMIPFAFGEKWEMAGVMTQYMAPMLVFSVAVSPLTMLEWLGKNNQVLIWHIIRLVLIIAGFYISHVIHLSAPTSIGIFSLITAIMYIVLLLLNRHAIDEVISGKITLT